MRSFLENEMDIPAVINGAVGSESNYCMGYGNPGASGNGYITTIKLSVGTVDVEQPEFLKKEIPLDIGTAGIVSYDRCEVNDAYIGGLNMITASSFTGINGAVWGYNLAVAENLRDNELYKEKWKDGSTTSVYSIEPLLDATKRLYGTAEQRRFNPLPGSMVICANKSETTDARNSDGAATAWVWSFIALSFVEKRSDGANLFIEDCGSFDGNLTEEEVKSKLEGTMRAVTKSIVLCGEDQNVKYKETFIGYKYAKSEDGQVGCALACAPYVTLAKNAIPQGMSPCDLMNLSIGEWEKKLNLDPIKDNN